ncbi:MAG: hypothetical protein ACI9P3_002378 [Bradyrhizobium sp.]|jgi:hypothetical protein
MSSSARGTIGPAADARSAPMVRPAIVAAAIAVMLWLMLPA